MSDTLGAAMIRAYLRNQSCADRGGRCDCDLTCRLDMDDIVEGVGSAFRAEVRAIMSNRSQAAQRPAHDIAGKESA